VSVPQIDAMLVPRYTEMFKYGLFGRSVKTKPIPAATDAKASLRVAEAGTVLLSNPSQILPLDPKTVGSVAVIGPWTTMASSGGGGSSHVTPLETVSPLQGIERSVGPGVKVYSYHGPDPTAAAAVAKEASVAIVVVGDVEAEGTDRPNLSLPPGQDYLIDSVAAANPHTIVVVHTGAPVLMPWLVNVSAVVMGWYPGEDDGLATAAVLFGAVDPGGRLPITFPANTPG
jgi:beta-glucosidase